MKAVQVLLALVVVIGLLNLLQGFGVFGGGKGGSHEYASYTAEEVSLFITYLVREEYKDEADAEGNVTIPRGELFDIRQSLPRLLNYLSAEGWDLVEIKEQTGLHVFRRRAGSGSGDAPRPWETDAAATAPAAGETPAAPDATTPATDAATDSATPAPLPTPEPAPAPAPAPANP